MPRHWIHALQPDVKKRMNELARAIDTEIPLGTGFVLLMFDFGEGGFMNYISNAQRDAMIPALKELISMLEHKPD